jgi:SOS response regulatory protein OraA/RecX
LVFDTFAENEWRGKRSLEMLSRKHFVELAKALAESEASENVIDGVIAFCKSENPRFLEYRFRNYIRKIRRDSL